SMVIVELPRKPHIIHVRVGRSDVIDASVRTQQVRRRDPTRKITEIAAIKAKLRASAGNYFVGGKRNASPLEHQLIDCSRNIFHIASSIEYRATNPVESIRPRTALRAVDDDVLLRVQEAIA